MRYFLMLLFFPLGGILHSQSWSQVVDFLGSHRDDAASFSIGDYGYVMTGMNSSFATTNDGFKYHPYTYIWYPMDTLPFEPRQYSCAFVINDKGYLIGGSGAAYYNDCWEYDPDTDTWIEMDSIPSFGRSACTCFTINGKGYIGTGATTGNILTDEWWEFSPDSVDQWEQKNNFGGGPRKGAASFSVNGKGYLIGGIDSNLIMQNDVWEYDPVLDNWLLQNIFPGTPRFNSKAISVNNTGYLMTGWDSTGIYTNDLWQYNDGSDSWIELDTIPAVGRKGVSLFTVNGNIFLATGIDNQNNRLTETWAFGSSIGIEEEKEDRLNIYPNPSNGTITITGNFLFVHDEIKIQTILGTSLHEIIDPVFPLDLSLDRGIYIISYKVKGVWKSEKIIIQ